MATKLTQQNVADIIALTPVQEGMLFHYLSETGSELYFEQFSFRISGNVDTGLLRKAWDFVIANNEMLRTVFKWEKVEKPVQIILKDYETPLSEHDFSGESPARQAEFIAELRLEDRRRKIDIGAEPYRILLCKLDHREYEMIVSSYHIVFDGWSNGIILKELLAAYDALLNGLKPELTPKSKYKEFLKWLNRQDKQCAATYWRNYFEGFDTKTLLPNDYGRRQSALTETFMENYSADLTAAIHQFARAQNITVATLLYSVWGILLQKYNNIDDVVFGTTVAGRPPEIKGVEDIVGLFINTPPLRLKANATETVTAFLSRMERMLRERTEFEYTPLTEIRPLLEIQSQDNLFDSIVVIENYPLDQAISSDGRGLRLRLESIFEMTNYDLTFVISTFDQIHLRLIYDAHLFKRGSIERITRHFATVIRNLIRYSGESLAAINILTENEREQLLFDFNRTGADYPSHTIVSLFEEQVLKTPDAVAVRFGTEALTYRRLNEKANQLAAFLRRKGVTAESVVGLILDRSFMMVVSLLGILKAGAAYLPIDSHLPVERVQFMLQNAGVGLLITESKILEQLSFTALQGFEDNDLEIVITNPRTHIQAFDQLPLPDRSLINLNNYRNKIGMASVNHCITLQTTRGCPYQCLYCHKIWSKHHVHRSAENILREISYYYQNGVRNFAVIDDCFNLNIKNSSRLFELIVQNGLNIRLFFPNGLRGDILTPEYIDLMAAAGTRGINLSLETASPRLQKLLEKHLDLERFRMVVEYIATQHPEIILEMATMHGFPTETEEEAMLTLDFIKSIKWLHFPYVHILKIFPNTEMEAFALAHGVSKTDILRSRNRAFHELPETLPFPKSFTRRYQSSFLNEYFLSKERLRQVLPVEMRIMDESALVQKYNAYLPVTIKNIADLVKFAGIEDLVLPEIQPDPPVPLFHAEPKLRTAKKESRKILLLDLSQHFSSHSMLYKVAEQPLGLIYLLTYLKQELGEAIEGRIYKSGNDFDSFAELKSLVTEFSPDLIGIRTLTYFKEFFHETVALLRQWGITAPIITGGPYASSDYDSILKDGNIDLVVFGEGETTLTELVREMLRDDFHLPEAERLQKINGIAFRPPAAKLQCQSRQVLVIDHLTTEIAAERLENLPSIIQPENLAYVMYTSGTTGQPKGIMVEHRQVNNCLQWMQQEFKLDPQAIVAQRTNLTFDPSVWEIFWPLSLGAQVQLMTAEQARDAGYLLGLLAEKHNNLTVMYCPASLLTGMTYLLDTMEPKPKLKLPWLLIGAEPITMDVVKRFYRSFEGQIVNTYGPTECTINNTYYYLEKDDPRPVVPIGKPVANNQIYILSKDLQPMPLKLPGEIYIAGASVARGYIHNPEKTAAQFIPNPFGSPVETYHDTSLRVPPDLRLYKTGDLGRWLEDGNIEILGRMDEQVKIRGYRIELSEIEAALSSHPVVNESVVIVKDNKKRASGIQVCRKCGITTAYPNIQINENGTCQICQEMDLYQQYSDQYFKTLNDLDELLKQKNAGKKSKYDCLLLYSGGRGSAYALYHLVEKGYQVLAATYDNGYFSQKDLENIKKVTAGLGVDHLILQHPRTDAILKESLKIAQTVCRGCYHTSSSLAAEYAYKNQINVVVGATLSRGQIIENKLFFLFQQGISDLGQLEKEIKSIQKSAPEMDKAIFDLIDIDVIKDKSAYDNVTFVDFYRFCDVTNEALITYLNDKDPFWRTRKNYAIYSTNCAIKQTGDYYHLKERGFHYYGSATSWERRLGHLTLENVKEDLTCHVKQVAFDSLARRIHYEQPQAVEKLETQSICAYYVSSRELTTSDLREHLLAKLPEYMIPSYFINIDQIPLTANGKIDKKALPEPVAKADASFEYVAPENETEERLAEIWKKVIGMERVGVNDNFFEIGGNSILLIQMHTQIEKQFPGQVTITDLFAYPTIGKLAFELGKKMGTPARKIQFQFQYLPAEYFTHESTAMTPGAAFTFKFTQELTSRLCGIAKNEQVDMVDLIQGMYLYLFTEITGTPHAAIQSLVGDGQAVSMEANLAELDGFSALFQRVRQIRSASPTEVRYRLSELDRYSVTKEPSAILPLFYERKQLKESVRLMDIYDLILEMNEHEGQIDFTQEYNTRRMNKEKVKELMNEFMKLVEIFVEKYQSEEVAVTGECRIEH
ncbi:MAG TPA: amino acid adenylation domain-containing protein [Bacillota bacterium]|nr:amino acid adenylation domain-containing protein [Bacillota bacterium]